MAQIPNEPKPADQAEWYKSASAMLLLQQSESEVQRHEDDKQGNWHDRFRLGDARSTYSN